MNKELVQLMDEGITSIKIYSTYPALKLNDTQILDTFYAARRHGVTVSKSRSGLGNLTIRVTAELLYDHQLEAAADLAGYGHTGALQSLMEWSDVSILTLMSQWCMLKIAI